MHVRELSGKAIDLPIRSLMAKNVATVHAEDSLHRAAKIMHERDCGCVVVVDRNNHVTGVLTDRDIAIAAFQDAAPLKEIPVAVAMTRDPITIRPEERLGEALVLMRSSQVRRLPVVDGKRTLLGLLTLGDIVRVIAQMRRRGEDPSASDAIVETFAAIGERRPTSLAALVCST
jgi:CBS domain-containing protein